MDHITLERRLAQAEGHVTLGEHRVARQHEIIAALAWGRHNTASARQLLAIFERTLSAFCLHRDLLHREWAHGSRDPDKPFALDVPANRVEGSIDAPREG